MRPPLSRAAASISERDDEAMYQLDVLVAEFWQCIKYCAYHCLTRRCISFIPIVITRRIVLSSSFHGVPLHKLERLFLFCVTIVLCVAWMCNSQLRRSTINGTEMSKLA